MNERECCARREPVGAVKTVTYNIAGLPPVNSMVRHNDVWGMALLADCDFSFSVNDDAGVLSARLRYQCGHRGTHQGNLPVAQTGSFGASPPVASGAIHFRSAVPVGYQQTNDAPCGQPGIAFNRADAQCRKYGSRQGIYSRVVFRSCTLGATQSPIRHRVNIEVQCAPWRACGLSP